MEVCANRVGGDKCVLLATFDGEDMSHVNIVGQQILIDVLDTRVSSAHLRVSKFLNYSVRLNPVRSF